MENAILPLVSSQIYNYGNSEPVVDIPVMMDSKLNANGSSFSTYARVYNDCNQLRDGVFAISHPTPIKYQSGTGPCSTATLKRLDCPHLDTSHLITASGHGNILDQQQLSLFNKLPFPAQFQTDFQVTVTRKRSIEDGEKGHDNRGNVDLSEWRTNKKTLCFQEQWDSQIKEELKEIQRQRVQGRRSLKLSDKITALQKLVSPYGKTDTASVLHEACISIKALQDQIQKLFRSSSDSYTSTEPLNLQRYEEKQLDLRSRGFGLVPVSFTQKLINEDQVGQRISTVIPRNM